MDPNRLHREAITDNQEVFRFVRVAEVDDPVLLEDFRSDRSRGKRPLGRAQRLPELRDGLSAFKSRALAIQRWQDLESRLLDREPDGKLRLGDYIARLVLRPDDAAFWLEDLGGPDGHLTIWGAAEALVAAVAEIRPIKS